MRFARKLTAVGQLLRGRRSGVPGARLGRGVIFRRTHGSVETGEKVVISADTRIAVVGTAEKPARLSLGDHVRVGDRCIINVTDSVSIGADSEVSWDVQILDSDFHTFTYADGRESTRSKPITIGNHVLIGTGAIILKGVTIGDGAVIGAGSVISRDVAPFTMMSGNPAREIGGVVSWK